MTLAAVALGVGCGDAAPVPGPVITFDACAPLALIADGSATPVQRAGLDAAAGLWNQIAPTQLAAAAGSASVALLSIHFQTAAAPDHGLYDARTGEIFVNQDLTDAPLAVTVAHEIGHALGLVHIDPAARASVMNPGNLSTAPTTADGAELANLWGSCPPPGRTATP